LGKRRAKGENPGGTCPVLKRIREAYWEAPTPRNPVSELLFHELQQR
jgi:hypothetical protein